jgi:thiamine monophosphate synthase
VRSLADCWTIGRSVHAGDVVEGDLLDYVLFGTVFPSESKGNDVEVAEVQGLATAAASIRLPVIAIGGITPERAAACRAAGAAGVAAIGVFLPPGSARGAMGVEAAVAAFRRAW